MSFISPIRFIPVISLLTLFCVNAYPVENNDRFIDINTCVRLGLINNTDIKIVQKDVDIAEQKVYEAGALIYPRAELNFNFSRYDAKQMFLLPPNFGSTFLPPNLKPEPEASDYYSTRISVYQDIYSAGRHLGTLLTAKASLDRMRNQLAQLKDIVAYDIKQGYYQTVYHSLRIKRYRQALTVIEKSIADYTSKLRNAGNEDLSRAQVLLSELRSMYYRAEQDFRAGKLKLNHTAGLDLANDYILDENLKYKPVDVEISKCLAWAFRYRPELKQIRAQEDIDAVSINLAVAHKYPTIFFGFNYEIAGDVFPFPEKNWNATVNINLPVFDGWAGNIRQRQVEINAEKGRLRRGEYENLVEYDVRAAYNVMAYRQNDVNIRDTAVKEQQKVVDALTTKLAGADTQLIQFIQSQLDLLTSQDKYFQAITDAMAARAKLEQSMGKSIVE
ncbi:MAG: TolC family protein [Elusimicrobiota bacterium]